MPFQKNNKLSPGRRGFLYELEQQKEMTELLSSYLKLAKKINEGRELSPNETIKFDKLEKLVLKILDKLHANRLDIKEEIDNPKQRDDIEKLREDIKQWIQLKETNV